jgi:protein O-mannosyl-transferase
MKSTVTFIQGFLQKNKNYTAISLFFFAVLGFLLYAWTVNYDFTYMDDNKLVVNQLDHLKKMEAIPHAFTEDVFHKVNKQVFYYRPLLTISLAIDAMIGGGKLPWFHISNILLHILAVWMLFLFLTELDYDRMKSFLLSLIFLVHPILTQAVAWIPGRNDTLLALFLFPSMIFFLRFLKNQKTVDLIAHFLFYILALFSKETAIVIPVMALLFILLIHKKISRYQITLIAGWIIISITWLCIRHQVMNGFNAIPASYSFASIFHNLFALIPYIGKAIIPVGLSVLPFMDDMKVPIITGILALVFLTILLIKTKEKRWGSFLFAIIWFLLFLIPSFIRGEFQDADFMEHRIYISMAGLIIFFLETDWFKRSNLKNTWFVTPIILIILTFSILTIIHSLDYKNRLAFWNNAVKTSPSQALCYKNLGTMYYLENNPSEAEKYMRISLNMDPTEKMGNFNMAVICMKNGRLAESENFFLREIEVNPTYENSYFYLGINYVNSNRTEKAIELWEKLLTINPRSSECYNNLVEAYNSLNRKADVERICQLAKTNGIKLKDYNQK